MIIKEPADTAGLRHLWRQTFGDPEVFLDLFFTKAYDPRRCRCVYDADRPVAMLYWFDCFWENRKLAYLYAVATEEDYRNRGLCRKLMEDTHRQLEDRGYAGCILVPGEPGLFGFYERLGYETAGRIAEYTCTAGEPVALQQIDASRYAALRRDYLPPKGVIQTGPMLALLAGYASFYAGDGFILAAHGTKDQLTVCELLGKGDAPGILGALGCREGRFRGPGGDRPFAMLRRFDGQPVKEVYFGLALD